MGLRIVYGRENNRFHNLLLWRMLVDVYFVGQTVNTLVVDTRDDHWNDIDICDDLVRSMQVMVGWRSWKIDYDKISLVHAVGNDFYHSDPNAVAKVAEAQDIKKIISE